ncbi:restriction endonuclease subunit S [Pseudomonas sp. CAU 1711]|uniref:restriction endonuclease subunit S n=1 Tax=Pseudomonas sp. CAU 1711 TaxID=3140356 RepID=UPI0032601E3E
MTALLTDNLPLLAGAPNGIKKLRELILELAVRGKLVPQDPSDEPASELLKRIAADKAKLVAEGKIKKQKPLTGRDHEDPAFELPAGWAWARLSDVVNILNGRAYKKEELLDAGTPVLRVGNLFTSNHWYYSNLTLEEDKYCNPGDLLFAWSASFGPFIWQGNRSIYHYHIWKLDFYAQGQLNKHYLYNFLLEQTQEIKAAGHGVSMVHMTKEKMEKLVVPVPPLAEQHRIVAKVDKLMALCDRLEARQTDADSAHAQLVQALLDSLTQATDAADFAQSWQRLAEHFHALFTTESSIDALKQTLLQLAVMGKLVPQDHSDEPASELLKRIAEEKARLVAAGKLKKQKLLSEVGEEEQLFDLPKGWVWSRFGDICAIQGELVRPEDFPDLRQVAPDCIEKGTGRLTESRTVKESGVKGPNSRFYAGQIVYSKIRPSLSKAVLVDFDGLCSADMYPIDAFISSEFLLKEILSEVFLEQVRVAENRIKMPKLNQESLTNFVLPIPPLAEQYRIVAKVDQLMALCDQLKARLNQARQVHEQLADALVEQAVA